MVGCCGCTKSACYQDKDKVEYYVGGGSGYNNKVTEEERIQMSASVNGEVAYRGVAADERDSADQLAGDKLIRWKSLSDKYIRILNILYQT